MRHALGDSATKPHYVETVPKVGYRFISPVHLDGPRMPEAAPGVRGDLSRTGCRCRAKLVRDAPGDTVADGRRRCSFGVD